MAKNKITAAANSFGSGKDLVGTKCQGRTVVSATRRTMTLDNGKEVSRKGNHVTFEGEITRHEENYSAWGD